MNIRTIDSLLTMLVRLSALDFGLPPDFEPVFGDGLPAHFELFFDEVQEAARAGDAELNDLLSACCRAVRVGEMNAKERRQMARLQREVEELRKLIDDHFRVYREQSYEFVRVRMENEAWREMAREILEGGDL